MAEQGFKRKLTTILSADVVGYSRLMEDNEEATIQTLNTYRDSITTLIEQHRGRVVDMTGDNLMAEFASVVDAVKCAVETQKEIGKRNVDLPEKRRMLFRIGVNLGDIVEEDDRIYGDGVNVASRIEGLAEPGGVCLSKSAYDQIKKKLDFGFEYMGEHPVKNISEPVSVYKVLVDSERSRPLVEEKLELPDKPSIAVLPFVNMSRDPDQEYFSDGLTEQIINGLCKVKDLFVIARNSSFAYKGKSLHVQQVAKELGVRYILEGSVQKAADRVRITAQLIDTTTGYHLWSENYDRDLSDIFALQDEITLKIMNAMQIKLTWGEQARLWEGQTTSIQAFDKWMRGLDCWFRYNEKDNKQARHFFKEAINIDKSYVLGYVSLGYTYLMDLAFGWSKSPIESFEHAEKNVEKALALSDSDFMAHCLLGMIYLYKRQHEEAIKEGERGIELNPNGADAHVVLGFILIFSDEIELAIKLLERAFRLNPIPRPDYYDLLALAYLNIGQYEKAIELCEKALSGNPDLLTPHFTLAASYSSFNRTEEAHKAVEKVLRIDPGFSLKQHANTLPYKNQEKLGKFINALRKAGLPE